MILPLTPLSRVAVLHASRATRLGSRLFAVVSAARSSAEIKNSAPALRPPTCGTRFAESVSSGYICAPVRVLGVTRRA